MYTHHFTEAFKFDCLLVARLMSQQHATVSPEPILSNNFRCCHIEIQTADQNFYLNQPQYTDTRPTSPSADPTTPGAWQGSHWSTYFEVSGMTQPGVEKSLWRKQEANSGSAALANNALASGPTRQTQL